MKLKKKTQNFTSQTCEDPFKTVTIEGWKFLYYNAKYILDRLPVPPHQYKLNINTNGDGKGTTLHTSEGMKSIVQTYVDELKSSLAYKAKCR